MKSRKELLEAILSGEKLRQEDWKDADYVYFDSSEDTYFNYLGNITSVTPCIDHYSLWELWKEPKKDKRLLISTDIKIGNQDFPRHVLMDYENSPNYQDTETFMIEHEGRNLYININTVYSVQPASTYEL